MLCCCQDTASDLDWRRRRSSTIARVRSSDIDRDAKSNTAGTTAPVQYDLVEAIIAAT